MQINKNIEEYIESVEHEIEKLNDEFSGNISFRLNFSKGIIGNMNVELNRSLKM